MYRLYVHLTKRNKYIFLTNIFMRAKRVQKLKSKVKRRANNPLPLTLPVPMIVRQEIEILVPLPPPPIPSIPDLVIKPPIPLAPIVDKPVDVPIVEKPITPVPTVTQTSITQTETQVVVTTTDEPKPLLPVRIVKRLIDPILKIWNSLVVPIYNQFARLGTPINATIAFLSGKKTYLVSLGTIFILYSHYNKGQIDLNTLVHQGSEMLLAMTFRSAISQRNNTP